MIDPTPEGCFERLFRMGLWLLAGMIIVALVVALWNRRAIRIEA